MEIERYNEFEIGKETKLRYNKAEGNFPFRVGYNIKGEWFFAQAETRELARKKALGMIAKSKGWGYDSDEARVSALKYAKKHKAIYREGIVKYVSI